MSKHRLGAVFYLAISLVAAVGGCAAPPLPPPVAGAPVPLAKYDGTYQGRARLVSSQGTCPKGRYGVLEVADHTLNFAYLPDVIFVADVSEDGTMHGLQGTAVLEGRIADGRLVMTVKTPRCQSTYNATVIWNRG